MDNTQQSAPFNMSTRQSFIPLNAYQYSAGGTVSQQLPQVGFLAKLIFGFHANLSFSHTFAGSVNSNGIIPDPSRFIKRIRVYTNEGAEIINVTGIGAYLMNRITRSAYDPRNPLASIGSTNTKLLNYSLPTPAIDTTVDAYWTLELDIALGEQLQAGLILLQNPMTRIQCEISFGDAATDIYTVTAGSITVNSVQVNAMMEIFNVPDDPGSYPDLSLVQLIREETTSITNVGDFQYRPPLGNLYLDMIQQFENNGARMNPITDFTQLQMTYAQTQNAYRISPQFQVHYQRKRLGGIDLPDGVWWWDFSGGFGLPEVPNTRDAIDTSRITDLQLITGIAPSVTLVNAQVRTVSRMLAQISGR